LSFRAQQWTISSRAVVATDSNGIHDVPGRIANRGPCKPSPVNNNHVGRKLEMPRCRNRSAAEMHFRISAGQQLVVLGIDTELASRVASIASIALEVLSGGSITLPGRSGKPGPPSMLGFIVAA